MARVGAVVVSYRPDLAVLREVLAAARSQVARVCVVDNSPPAAQAAVREICAQLGAQCLTQADNIGLAAAQNQGIRALGSGVDAVLLLDQDSVLPAGAVAGLAAALDGLAAGGVAVAAVGPAFVDRWRPQAAPFIATRWGLRQKLQAAGSAPMRVDYVIASGSLIPRGALDAVGLMDEALFIDYVDIEWGLRARAKGLASFGVPAVKLSHAIGERPLRFLGRDYPMHSPLRHYYLMRNALLIYRRRYVGWVWRVNDLLRCLLRFGFYALVPGNRREHRAMMWRGLRDGLAGRSGRCEVGHG